MMNNIFPFGLFGLLIQVLGQLSEPWPEIWLSLITCVLLHIAIKLVAAMGCYVDYVAADFFRRSGKEPSSIIFFWGSAIRRLPGISLIICILFLSTTVVWAILIAN